MKIIHSGFRVQNIDKSIALYKSMGFTLQSRFEKPEPKAQVATVIDENSVGLELWQFAEKHPLNQYIGQHLAFLCDDARADAKMLLDQGFLEVIPYTEGVKLNYIFVQDEYGVVFELAENKK